MAWLHATPKPPPGTKRAERATAAPKLSRRDQMKKDSIPIQMPSNPLPHITARLDEIGLTEATGMGVAPLSWRTIKAWSALTGIDLDPWESRLLRQLSAEYVAESHRAESENCPPPWRAEVTGREQELELVQLKSVLG